MKMLDVLNRFLNVLLVSKKKKKNIWFCEWNFSCFFKSLFWTCKFKKGEKKTLSDKYEKKKEKWRNEIKIIKYTRTVLFPSTNISFKIFIPCGVTSYLSADIVLISLVTFWRCSVISTWRTSSLKHTYSTTHVITVEGVVWSFHSNLRKRTQTKQMEMCLWSPQTIVSNFIPLLTNTVEST